MRTQLDELSRNAQLSVMQSSESAVLIECFAIPSPESALPIRLAFFTDLPATPGQTPEVMSRSSDFTCSALPLSPLLEVITKALDVAVGDDAGDEAEEGFVDVVASFPSNP